MVDPLVLALIVVALPRALLARALGASARRPVAAVLVLVGVAVAGWVGPVPGGLKLLLVQTLYGVALLVELVVGYGHGATPRRRFGSLAVFAGGWTLLLWLTAGGFLKAPWGTAGFWLVDVFDRGFLATVHPTLVGIHAEEAVPFVLGMFSGLLVFLSNHLLGLSFAASLVIGALTYELMRGKVPALPRPPSPMELRLPRWVPVATLALYLLERLDPAPSPLSLVYPLLAVPVLLRGAMVLALVAAESALVGSLALAFVVILALHPVLLWAVGALGALDVGTGLTRFASENALSGRVLAARTRAFLRALRLSARPVPMLLLLIAMRQPACTLTEPLPTRAPAGDDMAYEIDRYELPDRAGELPRTGLGPHEAEALCRERGRRLCTRDEWYWACSNGGERELLLGNREGASGIDRDMVSIVGDACNLGGRSGLLPSGEREGCVSAQGIHDLTGNALEWVRVDAPPGFWAVAGSYYAYLDDLTLACDSALLVHESQLDVLDPAPLGARCCVRRSDR